MTTIEPAEIQAQLEKILGGTGFSNASRLSEFLRYVVDQYVNNNQDEIKQYSIAVEALGYPSDFDPQKNPSLPRRHALPTPQAGSRSPGAHAPAVPGE